MVWDFQSSGLPSTLGRSNSAVLGRSPLTPTLGTAGSSDQDSGRGGTSTVGAVLCTAPPSRVVRRFSGRAAYSPESRLTRAEARRERPPLGGVLARARALCLVCRRQLTFEEEIAALCSFL